LLFPVRVNGTATAAVLDGYIIMAPLQDIHSNHVSWMLAPLLDKSQNLIFNPSKQNLLLCRD